MLYFFHQSAHLLRERTSISSALQYLVHSRGSINVYSVTELVKEALPRTLGIYIKEAFLSELYQLLIYKIYYLDLGKMSWFLVYYVKIWIQMRILGKPLWIHLFFSIITVTSHIFLWNMKTVEKSLFAFWKWRLWIQMSTPLLIIYMFLDTYNQYNNYIPHI